MEEEIQIKIEEEADNTEEREEEDEVAEETFEKVDKVFLES
jgi:hypothetical protein